MLKNTDPKKRTIEFLPKSSRIVSKIKTKQPKLPKDLAIFNRKLENEIKESKQKYMHLNKELRANFCV